MTNGKTTAPFTLGFPAPKGGVVDPESWRLCNEARAAVELWGWESHHTLAALDAYRQRCPDAVRETRAL